MSITPVFMTDDREASPRRRFLLVSYHFPPDAAIGARRWEKIARYIAERGWGLDVVMRHHGPMTDAGLARLRALPPGVRVYAVPTRTLAVDRAESVVAAAVRRVRRRTRGGTSEGTTAVPAAVGPDVSGLALTREEIRWRLGTPRGWLRMFWVNREYAQFRAWARDAERVARRVMAEASPGAYLAVASSGPPHMVHDAGRRIAKAMGVPFVMDMRDPWSCAEHVGESMASPQWFRLADRYEGAAVRQAALVVANTDVARDRLVAKYPDRRTDIITVMNGADDDPLPSPRRNARFSVAHAGTIYLDRDPRALFQASARVIRTLGLTPDQFGLDFIGEFTSVGGYPIHDVARQEGIENYVTVGASLPYVKAMEFMAGATMLLTMSGSSIAAIPAKTFECVRFQAWLLALSAPGSATERLLRGTQADVAASHDAEAIAEILMRRYAQHVEGVIPPIIGEDDRFSRRHQATVLLDAISDRI